MNTTVSDQAAALVDPSLLQGAVKSLGPTALVTTWLYYIGWVRTNRQADYFGLDPSLLGYSTTDYLLRSATSLFGPAAFLIVILIVVGWTRRWTVDAMAKATRGTDRIDRFGKFAVFGGLACSISGGATVALIDADSRWALAAAVLLIPGGLLLLFGQLIAGSNDNSRRTLDGLETLAVGLVLVAGLFCGGFYYALWVGEASARSLQAKLVAEPEVHLLTTDDLNLGGATTCQPIRTANSAYRCRYTGLRLLVASNDRLFLVPYNWTNTTNNYVFIVPDDDNEIRLDIRAS